MLATLVAPNKVEYRDVDGDTVSVQFSKSFLTTANANSVFGFDIGNVNGSNAMPQRLNTITLSGVAAAAGTTITTIAVRNAATGGDGFASLGQIDATGRDLSKVTIDGDLGRILAGDATTATPGLGALKVHSMGRFGTATGATDLNSVIQGAVASLTSASDIQDAFIWVQGGADGKLGRVTIGGSLIGGATANSGRILSSRDMGAVSIAGGIVGGMGTASGHISAGGKLTSLLIRGSLTGGGGNNSGQVSSALELGGVRVTGNIVGGAGTG
ncbi:MAG TPA: hypothetical protein VIY86_04510, partial [Pirellulaceae bacterium]